MIQCHCAASKNFPDSEKKDVYCPIDMCLSVNKCNKTSKDLRQLRIHKQHANLSKGAPDRQLSHGEAGKRQFVIV